MHRYYLDSNIFQIIKNDHPFHNAELRNTLDSLKGKVLFCFSDAHLDDLRRSDAVYRDADLRWMGEYVGDNYFTRNIDLQFQLYLATPEAAFNGKDYARADEFLANPGAMMDNLFKDLGDDPLIKGLTGILDDFLDQPITDFAPHVEVEKMDTTNKAWMDKIHPGFSRSTSVREFMKSNLNFSQVLNRDVKEMTALRRLVNQYISRDDYSWDKWKEDFNTKMKDTSLGKTFLESIDNMLLDKQKDDLYLKISYAYSMLEMFGVTQERNKNGIKKFTMSSLTTDAHHTYYASYTDYLVTDDKGMQLKAFIVYQLFNIPTKVLSKEDLIHKRHTILSNEESYETFSVALEYDLKHAFQLYQKPLLETGQVVQTYKTYHTCFNYFNRMQILSDGNNGQLWVLYCDRRSHANLIMLREIEMVTGKLLAIFGLDDEMKGTFDLREQNTDPGIRRWTIGKLRYELHISNKTWGQFLCLTIALHQGKGQDSYITQGQ